MFELHMSGGQTPKHRKAAPLEQADCEQAHMKAQHMRQAHKHLQHAHMRKGALLEIPKEGFQKPPQQITWADLGGREKPRKDFQKHPQEP